MQTVFINPKPFKPLETNEIQLVGNLKNDGDSCFVCLAPRINDSTICSGITIPNSFKISCDLPPTNDIGHRGLSGTIGFESYNCPPVCVSLERLEEFEHGVVINYQYPFSGIPSFLCERSNWSDRPIYSGLGFRTVVAGPPVTCLDGSSRSYQNQARLVFTPSNQSLSCQLGVWDSTASTFFLSVSRGTGTFDGGIVLATGSDYLNIATTINNSVEGGEIIFNTTASGTPIYWVGTSCSLYNVPVNTPNTIFSTTSIKLEWGVV